MEGAEAPLSTMDPCSGGCVALRNHKVCNRYAQTNYIKFYHATNLVIVKHHRQDENSGSHFSPLPIKY